VIALVVAGGTLLDTAASAAKASTISRAPDATVKAPRPAPTEAETVAQ
jgi:hypothetical protein